MSGRALDSYLRLILKNKPHIILSFVEYQLFPSDIGHAVVVIYASIATAITMVRYSAHQTERCCVVGDPSLR